MATRRAPRRAGALVVAAIALGGCEEHPITRPPDPPLGAVGWTAIALAVVLAAATWTVLGTHWLGAGRRRSTARTTLGGIYVGLAGVGIAMVMEALAETWRRSSILGSDGCRHLAFAERPRQIIQLTCDDLDDLGILFLLVVVVPVLLIGIGCSLMVLRGEARPWFPTIVAAAALAPLLPLLVTSSAEWVAGDAIAWMVAVLLSTTAVACGVWEIRHHVPLPTTATALATPVPTVASPVTATLADRVQALALDGLLVSIAVSIVFSVADIPGEPLVLAALVGAYSVATAVAWSGTVGQRALKLRIVDAETGDRPTAPAALLRSTILLVPPIALGLATSSALPVAAWLVASLVLCANPERLALHDRAARTRVVRTG